MRILATLILAAVTFSANLIEAAKENENINQNAKQILERKSTISLSDNFLTALYVPKVSSAQLDRIYKNRAALEKFVVPKKSFIANASAYTASADECGKSDGITASGAKVRSNHTLACPRQYSFGTKIRIEGMGIYVCEDRGGAIKGNHFDIYMTTKKEAFAFGRRNLLATVIE